MPSEKPKAFSSFHEALAELTLRGAEASGDPRGRPALDKSEWQITRLDADHVVVGVYELRGYI